MLAPISLREFTEEISISNHILTLKSKCKCGNERFEVYENIDGAERKTRLKFKEIIRDNDKLYYVKRNFFGKIVKKIECNDEFNKNRKVIKIKCDKCGEEYIIFDNYMHGYDAVINQKEELKGKDIKFNCTHQESMEIYIKLYQEFSYEELKEEIGNITYETYLDAYSFIDIYGKNFKSKKIKIHFEETA